ncbi:N-acetyltransferase [Neobacillus notoginsengisoli]|uniref:N-acetyltransferase n=1 Tax=Neobacillus notoginsengisoli TaxID=1578198 RepID=A0A417YW07_9BACI|nr:GNAT family N-acetyltransferase [Neobacillus notoginsengisoli]RHW41478.1 N-acetyltransferase [Neobacillus notoginsengisoli]
MQIRLAETKDIEQLIKMRWDFTLEDYPSAQEKSDYHSFTMECKNFLEQAISSGQWFIWVAEEGEQLVSHIYIELIQKVPRPGRVTAPFAYMTNVYTVKEYRGKGIGSKLISVVNDWVKENKYEFIIVWLSEDGVRFYERNGYARCIEPMEYFPN